LVPSKYTIVDLNEPKIIENGGESNDLEYLPTITEYIEYLQNASTCTSRLFVPLHYTILDLNKPKIIRNSRELTYLDHLPTKQKMQNISITQMRKPLVYVFPLNNTIVDWEE